MPDAQVAYEVKSEMSGSSVLLAVVRSLSAAKAFADLPTDANLVAVERPSGARIILNGR
jgi:hypothetical protein